MAAKDDKNGAEHVSELHKLLGVTPAEVRQEMIDEWGIASERVLVLPEDRTARRAIERHAAAVDAALPARSREVRTWLRQPVGSVAGVWFLTDVGLVNA